MLVKSKLLTGKKKNVAAKATHGCQLWKSTESKVFFQDSSKAIDFFR